MKEQKTMNCKLLLVLLALLALLCACGKEEGLPPTEPVELPTLYNPEPIAPSASVPETLPLPSSTPPAEELVTEPAPETTATEPVTEPPLPQLAPLEESLRAQLAGLPGVWSVYVKNLDSGEALLINDENMVAASLIKLYVAGAYFSTDPLAGDSYWCGQVDAMLSQSSNQACNNLIDHLGMESINDFIRACGDERSLLSRHMLENVPRENYISAAVCGRILEQLIEGSFVSPEASARMLQDLKKQERTAKLPAGVPSGVQTANKTGELSTVENDVMIVWAPKATYIVCVLSGELDNTAAARASIVELSRTVYDFFDSLEPPEQSLEPTGESTEPSEERADRNTVSGS